jgi:hypothetical protein
VVPSLRGATFSLGTKEIAENREYPWHFRCSASRHHISSVKTIPSFLCCVAAFHSLCRGGRYQGLPGALADIFVAGIAFCHDEFPWQRPVIYPRHRRLPHPIQFEACFAFHIILMCVSALVPLFQRSLCLPTLILFSYLFFLQAPNQSVPKAFLSSLH